MWQVQIHLVEEWLKALDDDSRAQVVAALELLQEQGPTPGRPLVDTLNGSDVKNLKELRPGSRGKSELRLIFAFDPKRRAIMLVAGDKRGSWDRWYRSNIPKAEHLYRQHLQHLEE